jgi:hypothetical protein
MRLAVIIALLMFCVGCEKGNYIDVGPVIIDKATLPESVEVK